MTDEWRLTSNALRHSAKTTQDHQRRARALSRPIPQTGPHTMTSQDGWLAIRKWVNQRCRVYTRTHVAGYKLYPLVAVNMFLVFLSPVCRPSVQGRFQRGVGMGAAPSPVKFVAPCGPKKFKIRPHHASEQKASAALVVILNVFLMLSCFVTF